MARLFGTDGVRALANGEVLTAELTVGLARSAVRVLEGRTVAIGRDTRPSGPMLEAAAAAGFASAGADVLLLGVVPTPTVAHVVASGAADLGLVISASHNAMPDNGLKIFGAGGHKLTDEQENAIEAGISGAGTATGAEIGQVRVAPVELIEAYLGSLIASAGSLTGLKVVVDCAQGAASALAPELYRRLGAEVIAMHADGDGLRINESCGATHPSSLAAAVVAEGAGCPSMMPFCGLTLMPGCTR